MESEQTERTTSVTVDVEGIGGIDESSVELRPGVNVLSGRNATNRTSFLQTIMAGLGSKEVSLKADADEGRVELDLDGRRHTRTLERTGDDVVFGGQPYLDPDQVELADLFAFLLESNEARRAVERGDDLRDLVMRPVDTDEIQSEIERLEIEKREIDRQLDELDELNRELPDLEERRTEYERTVEEKREELRSVQTDIEEANASIERRREDRAELETRLDELQSKRSDLERIIYNMNTERESVSALQNELSEVESELADLRDEGVGDREEIESEIERFRNRKSELDADITDLRSIIRFNEERVTEAGEGHLFEEVESGADSPTDRLVEDGTATCWTCGTEVNIEQIEATIDRLRELQESKTEERTDVQRRIEELTTERDELRTERRRRERLEGRQEELSEEIRTRKRRIADLRDQRDELLEAVDRLEGEIDDLERDDTSEILDLHREANEIEVEIERIEDNIAAIEDRIADVEAELDDRDRLQDRRETVREKLTDLRTRIDRIEKEAVTEFNEHMETVLELLEYENVERIWIERMTESVTEGRQTTERTTFDLHVVRTGESGVAYEDSVANLSESEREVTGLVFALAGYLTYDLHREVPFILLDSLEAIDAERIDVLVDHFADHADFVVVALLTEDARAIEQDHHRIRQI